MASTINAITTGAGGIVTTGDATGNISLQSNGTTVLATTASGVAVTGTLTANGVSVGSGGATTTSSAVDITLTSSSNKVQDVTMTAADKSVILPDATTLSLGGPIFVINNRGGRAFYIKNNGGVIIAVVKPFASVQLNLNANGTANGTWAKQEGDIFFGQYVPSQVTTDKSFIQGLYSYVGGQYGCYSNNNAGVVSVKKISSTTALILWSPADITGNSLQNLKAVVATVSAGSITYGTPVTVYTGTTTGMNNFGAVVLSSTAALVIIDKTGSNASAVYPLVLSGSTITVGTSVNVPSGATVGLARGISDICYLSATTAMISYVGNVGATNGLRAVTITHNGSSAPTASSAVAVNANIGTGNKLIPLTSTTCQLIYQTASTNTYSTVIVTSTGASTAPTLGTAIVTSYSGCINGADTNYGMIGYAYSSTETAVMVGNNVQLSFTISGTTITEQTFTNLFSGVNSFTNSNQAVGSIAWFSTTQGVYLRSSGPAYTAITTNLIPVSYTVGTGINVGDSNITTTTINGFGLGAIDQLDSTTAIAAIPYAQGLQAEVVTLL